MRIPCQRSRNAFSGDRNSTHVYIYCTRDELTVKEIKGTVKERIFSVALCSAAKRSSQSVPIRSTHSSKPSPHYGVLIRFSIQQREPESTLRWYDELHSSKSKNNRYRFERFEIEVADSVSSHFPNRAIELYCGEADRLAAETNTKLYPQAVSLLKKIRKILKAEKRSHEFEAILETFHQRHHRKRRLVELLRSLGGQPILSKKRATRT